MGWTWWHSGVLVAVLAVAAVVARVLWPKELVQRLRARRRFQTSVNAMQDGLAQLAAERYAAALLRFQQAAAQTPGKPAPVLLRIYALGLQGRRREAAAELQRARNRWKAATLPRRLLALAEMGAGEFDRAYATALAAVTEASTMAAAFGTLGDVCRLMERYPEAERAYLNAVRLGLARPGAGLAWCLAGQGRVEAAEDELAAVPPLALDRFEARLTLAQIHLAARRLDDALTVLRSLLTTNGDVPRVLVPFGLALLEAGQADEARGVLAHAAALSPDDPFTHGALASLLVERDDLAAATVHVREALRLWPGYGAARSVYGDILKRAGRYAAAEEHYREALRLNPFMAETHIRLAALLRTRGQTLEAQEHEREANRLRPVQPRPITQEILAITTRELAVVRPAVSVARTTPRPDRRPPPGEPDDLPVFPGAALIFDDARDAAFSQTLQTDRPAHTVITFYRQEMAANGWRLTGDGPSDLAHVEGVRLRFARGAAAASVTIGLRPGVPVERQTYIVTTLQPAEVGSAPGAASSGGVLGSAARPVSDSSGA